MEYNKLFIEQNISENCKDYVKKKKNNINIILIQNLKNKIEELENKLDFYNKYEKNVTTNNYSFDSNINNIINYIDNLIITLNKNIINNGQLIRKNKNIEFEF
jgi:hypothetical protein